MVVPKVVSDLIDRLGHAQIRPDDRSVPSDLAALLQTLPAEEHEHVPDSDELKAMSLNQVFERALRTESQKVYDVCIKSNDGLAYRRDFLQLPLSQRRIMGLRLLYESRVRQPENLLWVNSHSFFDNISLAVLALAHHDSSVRREAGEEISDRKIRGILATRKEVDPRVRETLLVEFLRNSGFVDNYSANPDDMRLVATIAQHMLPNDTRLLGLLKSGSVLVGMAAAGAASTEMLQEFAHDPQNVVSGPLANAVQNILPLSARDALSPVYREALYAGVNSLRQGVAPTLEKSSVLEEVAHAYALRLRDTTVIRHWDKDGNGPADRVRTELGRDLEGAVIGENIVAFCTNPEEAIQAWYHSVAGHRETMLGEQFKFTGVGMVAHPRWGYVVVQLFSDHALKKQGVLAGLLRSGR